MQRLMIRFAIAMLFVIGCMAHAQHERPSKPKELMAHAMEHFNRQQYREALEEFREVQKVAPKTPDLKSRMGQAYAYLGDRKNARRYLEACTIESPKDSLAWSNLSWLELNGSRYAAAAKAGQRAVALNRKNFDGWYNLSIALANTKRPKEAMDALRKAYAINTAALNLAINQTASFGSLAKTTDFQTFIMLAQQGRPVNQQVEVVPCPTCIGRREVECRTCWGQGQTNCNRCYGSGNGYDGRCVYCFGSGKVTCPNMCTFGRVKCSTCYGWGYVPAR